jgi:hypothetical protein
MSAHNGLATARQDGRVPRPLVPCLRGLCAFYERAQRTRYGLCAFDVPRRADQKLCWADFPIHAA